MLELKKLSAGYSKKTVLENLDLTFEKGKLTSLIGVNGCGKSTLLKLILGILPLKSGDVIIDGSSISSLKRNETAQRISYLSQGKDTPDMTVMQMVLHGRFPYLNYPRRYTSRDRDIAISAMERMGISHLASEPISSLSGGMRQNVYIAMALAQDTDYILLDEPTTYLDISHQLELMRILRELADSGKGIITVMHDLPLAFSFSDEVAILDGGNIVAKGDPLSVCALPLVREIFGVELDHSAKEGKFFYRY